MLKLQALCRGYLARRNHRLRIQNIKATTIQTHIRGWLARIRFKKMISGIIQLQAHVRRRQTRKIFKTLKIEARSVEHQKKLNLGLENKIISLQQQIGKISKERDQLLSKVNEIEPLKAQVTSLKQNTSIIKESNLKIQDLTLELSTVKQDYEKLKCEHDENFKLKSQLEKNLKEKSGDTEEIDSLKARLAEALENSTHLKKQVEDLKSQLGDIENERDKHQKLVKEFGKLEQRFEKTNTDLAKYTKNSKNINLTVKQEPNELESLIEEIDVKSATSSTADAVDNFEKNKLMYMTINGSEMDMGLLSKLQKRIQLLESERKEYMELRCGKANVKNDHDNNNNNNNELVNDKSGVINAQFERLQQEKDYELIKSQEFELENQKLREDLNRLRDLCADNQIGNADSLINSEMMNQFDALNEECQRRREECIQLKSILVSRHKMQAATGSDQGSECDSEDINGMVTDGNEFEIGYNTQKILNRILENQNLELKRVHETEVKEKQKELEKLREENDRQQEILMQNLNPESLAEATYKNEIVKLTEKTLELSEKCDHYSEEIKKYKKMLKVYIKRSKTMNIHNDRFNPLNSSSTASMNTSIYTEANDKSMLQMNVSTNTLTANGQTNNRLNATVNNPLNATMNTSIYVPQIKSRNSGEFLGVCEWKTEDETLIVRKLIDELKPRLAMTFLPGLPSYILFMCIRYADMINDDERVRSLLNSSIQTTKKLIKRKQEDLEYLVLWMTNFCRLIHNLKQYSGDTAFQYQNTMKQNEQCLKNFDLTDYRSILSDIAIWLFQGIIKDFENKLNPIIVCAMLEQESLQGMYGKQPTSKQLNGQASEKYTIDSLIKKLNEFLSILNSHGVDPEIVNQIFKQLFYFIAANTFNNLILRKEMCNWSKGIEIRYNMSQLEQWIRDSKLTDSGAIETLEPVIQASQLLQARKTDDDIKSLCEMCSKLTIAQIQRIMFLYSPLEAYEEKLTRQFIDKVTNKLKELRQTENNLAQQVLILDTKKHFSVYIPFNPSNIGLETIEIPEQFGLGFLKKI